MADLLSSELVALPTERAAQLAGLSVRQLTYWQATGLVKPEVDRQLKANRTIRLYGYVDLMSLLVIAELKRRKLSLQHIRAVVGYLRTLGYPSPLSELSWATQGNAVYFQHPDGVWEAGKGAQGQVVMHEVLDLTPLRARIDRAASRREGTVGHREQRRGTVGYKPVVAGTRLPVATIERFLAHGASDAEVVDAYPILQLEDVAAVRRASAVA